jgi:malonate transporter
MLDVLNLALPFFGLILLGLACGRLNRIPESGLAWMNFFIVYVALPALFYRILARTPLEQLTQARFILATTLSTFLAFTIAFAIALLARRHRAGAKAAETTIAASAGSYGNVGYMGPGLALSTLGSDAAAPVALIFCFDSLLIFSLVPSLMAVAGSQKGALAAAGDVVRRIVTNPFLVASALGALSAALHFEPPVALDRLMGFLQSSAAPCALFVLGVTVALRPFERVPWEVPVLALVKLAIHPAIALVVLSLLGPFAAPWMATAVLMAALPPALNVFVMARQYDVWVTQASGSVLIGTLMSVVTLTAIMWMVKTQTLPLPLFH